MNQAEIMSEIDSEYPDVHCIRNQVHLFNGAIIKVSVSLTKKKERKQNPIKNSMKTVNKETAESIKKEINKASEQKNSFYVNMEVQ